MSAKSWELQSAFWAVEVKNSRAVSPGDLRALKHFADDYPQAQRVLLYRGQDRLMRDGILCVPCEEFLLELKPGKLPKAA